MAAGGFYVMRHFERGENPEFSTNLTTRGHKRARELFVPGVERIVSSPFQRCLQSSKLFAGTIGTKVHIACALSEYIDDTRHGIAFETKEQMHRRVHEFIEADKEHRSKCTLYVTHGSIAEVLINEHFDYGDIRWVTPTRLEFPGSTGSALD